MTFKTVKKWIPLFVLTLFTAIAFISGLHEKISLNVLQDNKGNLLETVQTQPIITALGFIGIYVVFVALSLPAATLLTLTGGFLFGPWLGTLYVVIAATIGATIIFFIAKTSLGSTLRDKAGGLYTRIESNMNDNATGYMLFMRLVPIFPFFLVNIVPALFNVKPRTYILTTFFGIMPGSFVFVNLGGQLADIESLNDLVSFETLAAFAMLGIFALIPTMYKQLKAHKKALSVIAAFILFMTGQTQAQANDYNEFLNLYDGLLRQYTKTVTTHETGITYEGVDYDGWAADDHHAKARDIILTTDIMQFETQDAQMAFWINAYNFLTIDLITRENERETIKNLGGFLTTPWAKHTWTLSDGKDYTLDAIEHDIIRPMGDARIHFAVNCAAISCPDLRNKAYRAENLDQQLDEQTRLALDNTTKGFRRDGDRVFVSKILDWFGEDFNDGDLKSWLGDYVTVNADDRIRFMDYDWSLNKAQ